METINEPFGLKNINTPLRDLEPKLSTCQQHTEDNGEVNDTRA